MEITTRHKEWSGSFTKWHPLMKGRIWLSFMCGPEREQYSWVQTRGKASRSSRTLAKGLRLQLSDFGRQSNPKLKEQDRCTTTIPRRKESIGVTMPGVEVCSSVSTRGHGNGQNGSHGLSVSGETLAERWQILLLWLLICYPEAIPTLPFSYSY